MSARLLCILLVALHGAPLQAVERDKLLHASSSFAATMIVYGAMRALGVARPAEPRHGREARAVGAAFLVFAAGAFVEMAQAADRQAPIDGGDLGANLLGTGAAAGSILLFEF